MGLSGERPECAGSATDGLDHARRQPVHGNNMLPCGAVGKAALRVPLPCGPRAGELRIVVTAPSWRTASVLPLAAVRCGRGDEVLNGT